MMLLRNKAIFLVKNVFAILSIYLFPWQCAVLIYCPIKHRQEQSHSAMPSGRPTIPSQQRQPEPKNTNTSTLGGTTLAGQSWLHLLSQGHRREAGVQLLGECKGLVILDRGNGVSLVCEPTALGFPFYWMVNLTAADDLLVGFGGREAKTGTDEDGDGAGLSFPCCLPSQDIFSL